MQHYVQVFVSRKGAKLKQDAKAFADVQETIRHFNNQIREIRSNPQIRDSIREIRSNPPIRDKKKCEPLQFALRKFI